jgi:TRAP-type mannitol/chloroaromatic compound transport system permease large subunit
MKLRRELWFGLIIMAMIVLPTILLMPWTNMTSGHYGLMMLALVVVAIMLGFPTAFTLMGMGMIFAFVAYLSQKGGDPGAAAKNTLDLMVQRTFGVMNNDVLISIPLFVFMGYLVERANLIEKLFKSLHLSLARVPGALAVATLITCAVFATATGIVGAVVTLMGLLALPAMLKAGYSTKLAAGAITAGGCLGILIPPSVMLIVYGATAGVSVVKLYAGAFFPGLMLALLYVLYVIVVAKLKPELAPPLTEEQRRVPLPPMIDKARLASGAQNAAAGLLGLMKGKSNANIATGDLLRQVTMVIAPAIVVGALLFGFHRMGTKPAEAIDTGGLVEMGVATSAASSSSGIQPLGGVQEPPKELGGVQEPPKELGGVQEPPKAESAVSSPSAAEYPAVAAATSVAEPPTKPAAEAAKRSPTPTWFWWMMGIAGVGLAAFYGLLSWARFEIFKMLLGSFFPLAVLILAVLGTIVFGLATPTEAAAVGSLGGVVLAWAYKQLNYTVVKESVYLTAKTSAMVCWLFVGSSIFSAAFALLGGQELIEKWVLSLGLTTMQFLILSQFIIFILGWPLEWTEIIVIFMPIFIPLLAKFNVDPLFFGLLVALNLQTAFLSPPVAMAAFYLKGVAPPHVTLNQIFAGMIPFMMIQVIALVLLYVFPAIGMWLPSVLYK